MAQHHPTVPPAGVESETRDPTPAGSINGGERIVHSLSLSAQHLCLTQVTFMDATDHRNELVHEKQWLLHPSEKKLSLRGNLFIIEDKVARTGRILIKVAPLPEARPLPLACDLRITPAKGGGFNFDLLDHASATENNWVMLDYQGGAAQRTKALHDWQAAQRPATEGHRCPRFLSNTWGDRSRDSRITASFMVDEIKAAHRLGVDVVQIDDGWQKGVTANSAWAKEYGGVWEGFWNADPDFWEPHPERFPDGLEPIVELARSKGTKIGLWFAPDSWNDFANWQLDANKILQLYTTLGVTHFKIDGVKTPSQTALANLQRFFKTVLQESRGNVVFDLDITAGVRPGYFGAVEVGPLFVENRYTDWHNYWPHHTLRNLWMLSHWVDPRRLRMEFLNHTRNTEQYANDPLAPSQYEPATLFATVMFANPLGWFEVSNLPADYVASVAPLIQTWRSHRQALFAGNIMPIGNQPDGFSPTGFLSVADDGSSGYALVFRGLHTPKHARIALPDMYLADCAWQCLSSTGSITSRDGQLCVEIDKPLGFVFAHFTHQRGT